jgi:hypothetical protein
VLGFSHRWGYYWLTYHDKTGAPWTLHYAGSLKECERYSEGCFAIGDIENTEGSPGGP